MSTVEDDRALRRVIPTTLIRLFISHHAHSAIYFP
jgi:hypothetical protein